MSQSRTRNYWSNTLQYSILVLLEQNFLVPNRIGIVFFLQDSTGIHSCSTGAFQSMYSRLILESYFLLQISSRLLLHAAQNYSSASLQ